jgi:hypothetical protein
MQNVIKFQFELKAELGKVVMRWEPLEEREGETFGRLDIAYHGDYEEPDYWLLSWSHYRSFLMDRVPDFLVHFFPGKTKDFEKLCEAIQQLPEANAIRD